MSSTYVLPKGLLNAPYIFVGEQPGRQEVRYREPFIGPAGDNLNQCLHTAEILRSECYLTNVIKDLDYPLENYIEFRTGRNASANIKPMGKMYIELLKEELLQTTGNIIIACGNVALWALCSRIGITHWRGSVIESTLLSGRKVIPIIHPATWTQEKLYANPDAYLNRYLVIRDLKQAKQESMYPEILQGSRKLITRPTYHEAMKWINTCIEVGMLDGTIDYDIEIQPHNQELSCIGLTYTYDTVMCIPFVDSHGDYFSVENELNIMLLLDKLFSSPHIKKRGQNVIFDSHYLLKKYGIRTHNLSDDTMVAQGIIYPEFRKALEFITSLWTDIPYYKSDGKIWLEGTGEWQRGWEYNCLDVFSCAVANPKQVNELREQGNYETYVNQTKLISPLTYMMEHGIKIDIEGMRRAGEECENEISYLTEKIYKTLGKEINLMSPKQLIDYFYGEKRIKPYLHPDTKKPTVDITALKRIANQGYKEASDILKLRQLSKKLSTFLDLSKIDSDGRMRCSYNPVGTKFGRISSSENIFGTGTNLQNQPHDVLTYFVADEGYVVYSLDMSQIENRIVAYVGNVRQMIEAFEQKLDSHRVTAALMLSLIHHRTIPLEEITSEERQDYGKRPNHAFNYGFGPNSFSLKYEVPQSQAKILHSAYHNAYPGLRNNYWAYVQQQLKTTQGLTTIMGRYIPFFGKWSDKLLHEAYSAIPQSTCGDLMNQWGINYTYYNKDADFKHVELLTQIHDSMEIQLPLSLPLEVHARILLKIRASLETPLTWKGIEFSIPADLTINNCLNKEKGIELKGEKFPWKEEELVNELQKATEGLGLCNSTSIKD